VHGKRLEIPFFTSRSGKMGQIFLSPGIIPTSDRAEFREIE
jgi:hypothetical protein